MYKRAYRIIGDRTPLKVDCGALCGKACCNGDENNGMYIYPGEEEVYGYRSSFLTSVKPTSITLSSGRNVLLAVCEGKCMRIHRPLSCRIFPLIPYIDADSKISIKIDIRANNLCPLALNLNEIDKFFIAKVIQSFRLLCQDTEIYEFVRLLSKELDGIEQLRSALFCK